MGSKEKEKECFKRLLKCKSVFGSLAQSFHKELCTNTLVIDDSGECPDLIIANSEIVFGIEHFQVDELFEIHRDKAKSLVGSQQNKCQQLVDKYHDKDLLDQDIKTGKAISPILDMVEERERSRSSFDYGLFISNCNRICKSHNLRTSAYKERITAISFGKKEKIYCLLEIPFLKVPYYWVTDAGGKRKQAIKGIPITKDILTLIEAMTGFDCVILCIHPLEEPPKGKHNICYYFDPKNVRDCATSQGIHIFNTFALPNDSNFHFDKSRTSVDKNGNINIEAIATISKRVKIR